MHRNNVVQYPNRTRRKGVSKLFWLLLLIFSFSSLFVLYLASPLALVAEVSLAGNETLSDAEILAAVELEPGQHFWRLDLAASKDKLSANPWISEVRISRVFPNSLAIAVKERKGIAVIAAGNEYWVAAGDGTVLAINEGYSLPWVTGLDLENLEPGVALAGQASSLALEWIIALQPLSSQVSELNFSTYPAYTTVFTTDGFKVLFPCDSDLDQRVWDLNALLQELRAENQKGIIDFRTGAGRAIFSPWPANSGIDN